MAPSSCCGQADDLLIRQTSAEQHTFCRMLAPPDLGDDLQTFLVTEGRGMRRQPPFIQGIPVEEGRAGED